MRGGLVQGSRAELMDTLGRETAIPVPGDKHDERVTARSGKCAVRLGDPVDGTERVRAAIDRKVHLAAPNAIHFTPFGIESAEMLLQSFDGGSQRIDEIDFGEAFKLGVN